MTSPTTAEWVGGDYGVEAQMKVWWKRSWVLWFSLSSCAARQQLFHQLSNFNLCGIQNTLSLDWRTTVAEQTGFCPSVVCETFFFLTFSMAWLVRGKRNECWLTLEVLFQRASYKMCWDDTHLLLHRASNSGSLLKSRRKRQASSNNRTTEQKLKPGFFFFS